MFAYPSPPATASCLSPFPLYSPSFFLSLLRGGPTGPPGVPLSPSIPAFLEPPVSFADPCLEPESPRVQPSLRAFPKHRVPSIPGCRRSRAREMERCLFNERSAQALFLTHSLASALIFNQLNTESGRRERVLPACVLIRNASPGCRPH